MSKKTIVRGTLILTIAGVITKVLGFYNRIFLTGLIGITELGKYQLVFPIYMLVFAICSQGISTTLTKQVSYHIGAGQAKRADYILSFSILLSVSLSLIIAILIYLTSDMISMMILGNTDCGRLLRIITIAIPFVAFKSCINFYFIGIDKPGYHGFSHLIEQIIRITAAYVLSISILRGRADAVLAVIAVVIGEISATVIAVVLFYIIRKRMSHNDIFSKLDRSSPVTMAVRSDLRHGFAKDAIPITLNNLILTSFTTLETIIMPAMLCYYYHDSDTALEAFGMVTGIVIPFILFPATITTSLSTMLLPAVAYANARHDEATINEALKKCIIFCIGLGVLAAAGFYVLGEPVCELAFKSKEAGLLLKKLCFLCPLIYTSGNLTAILNGIDRSVFALICNIIAISIRIACMLLLVPRLGLTAYAIGMFASYTVINLLMLTGISQFSISKRRTLSDIKNN